MLYKNGYKFRLQEGTSAHVGIYQVSHHEGWAFIVDGTLFIKEGYAWDGASGAIDTKTIMRASLVHDALYQLMREGVLSPSYRKHADQVFYRIMREDGMNWIRAQYIYLAVRLFGKLALKHDTKVQTAP